MVGDRASFPHSFANIFTGLFDSVEKRDDDSMLPPRALINRFSDGTERKRYVTFVPSVIGLEREIWKLHRCRFEWEKGLVLTGSISFHPHWLLRDIYFV